MPEPLADRARPAALTFDPDGELVDRVKTRFRAWLASLDELEV